MRKRVLVSIGLILTLAGCGWIEEAKKHAARQQAETELVEAAGAGDLKTVRAVLERDRTLANAVRWVSGRRRSYRAESALTMALKQGRREMVDLLLDRGADPNLADGSGTSPLEAALSADKDRPAYVARLLEKAADPDRDYGGRTALHAAAESSHSDGGEALRLLLAKASGVGGPDARGRMPLHLAAQAANVPGLRLLIAKGADPNGGTQAPKPGEGWSDDVAGATPLAIVARDRQIDAAANLCARGADPDVKDATGASARQVALRVATAEAAKANPIDVDLARHENMVTFLAKGGACDALLARQRRGEEIADAEVDRIANESECNAGWGWACGQAGWAYYRGEGAEEDDARALALFRRGCETALTKNEWSCGMAGILQVDGRAAPKDPVEGARWLKKGCEPTDPKRADEQACNRLGLLYAEGSGVPKDLGRARVLFKRACDGKNEKACANLLKYTGD